ACLHLAASTPNFKIQEHFNDFVDAWVKEAAKGPGYPEVKDGYFPLPGGPGLGVTLNEDFIREHPMQGETFNLFKEDWSRRQSPGKGKAGEGQEANDGEHRRVGEEVVPIGRRL